MNRSGQLEKEGLRRGTGLQQKSRMIQNQENVVSSSEGPEPRLVIPARQARQGVIGHNVRLVLGFSLAAIVIVFTMIWIVYFA